MDYTPHIQPQFCERCGFVFYFEGCATFHLAGCPECDVAYQRNQHEHRDCPNLDGVKIRYVRVGEIP